MKFRLGAGAAALVTTVVGLGAQGAGIVSKYSVPAGQPVLAEQDGADIRVTTKSGYSYLIQSTTLQPTGKTLGQVADRKSVV